MEYNEDKWVFRCFLNAGAKGRMFSGDPRTSACSTTQMLIHGAKSFQYIHTNHCFTPAYNFTIFKNWNEPKWTWIEISLESYSRTLSFICVLYWFTVNTTTSCNARIAIIVSIPLKINPKLCSTECSFFLLSMMCSLKAALINVSYINNDSNDFL